MSYKTTIPNPSDFLAISQRQILANYQAIYNAFSINHVALDSINKIAGYHTSFTLRNQALDPVTGATEVSFYNKNDGSSVPQLFYRPSGNGTPIQMTNSNTSLIFDATQLRRSIFLPGPFTLYTGYIRDVTDGTVVTLLPSTTLKYVGLISVTDSANGAVATLVNLNQFTVKYGGALSPPKRTIYYMAIGLS